MEPEDLEKAKPEIRAGDIVLINTGWHDRYADSKEYFGYAPGLSKQAAEWLVKKKVKLVGVDTACVDHPLATSLGPHRNGPQIKYLLPEYKKAKGRDAIKDFPEWNVAHKVLLGGRHPDHRERWRRTCGAVRQALHVPGLPMALVRGRRLCHPPGRDPRSEGDESA